MYEFGTLHCELSVDLARGALEREIFGRKPSQAEQQDQRDDRLRHGAIKTPRPYCSIMERRNAKRNPKHAARNVAKRWLVRLRQPSSRYPAMPKTATGTLAIVEKLLRFTVPHSQCALMSQGAVVVE
jgi:hypothetical protein